MLLVIHCGWGVETREALKEGFHVDASVAD
jgi:hypothetical protein